MRKVNQVAHSEILRNLASIDLEGQIADRDIYRLLVFKSILFDDFSEGNAEDLVCFALQILNDVVEIQVTDLSEVFLRCLEFRAGLGFLGGHRSLFLSRSFCPFFGFFLILRRFGGNSLSAGVLVAFFILV